MAFLGAAGRSVFSSIKIGLITNSQKVVYLASGTYEVKSTINLRTNTILMGNAADVSQYFIIPSQTDTSLTCHGASCDQSCCRV
jgi:hypothetical protein